MALKILLADDSMTAQKLGQKILTDAGHEVIAVSNGAAAVKRIAEHKPDLLVLDVFMPGYSGLEVCAKVRAGAEGAKTPVLLTVGQMEHFDPAEAEKVKADGVIVKPFVAKDLEDLVRKIEEKLKAPPAAEPFQPTVKMEAFQDASYEEWKVTAEGHEEGETSAAEGKLEVPQDMASSSAFGDMLGDETPEPAPALATEVMTPPTQVLETAPAVVRAAASLEPAAEMPAEPAAAEPAHEVEFTSAPKAEEVKVEAAPELEPTIRAAEESHAAGGMDPALITDATEMASAFPTKFGVEGAEIVPVGVAADMPELYTDSQTPAEASAEAPVEAEAAPTTEITAPEPRRVTEEITAPAPAEAAPGWSAQAETLGTEEASRSLEQEMAQAFANVPVDTQPAEEPPPPPPPVMAASPAPAAENVPDPLLAAAMEAAVAGGPAPTITLDANTIANIVHRVTERMKPELIAEIARELASEAERSRKP
ncbi:MAG: response regulator [Terriglobales bacterium]